MHIRNSQSRAVMHRFYLISPKSCSLNACDVAGKLLALDCIEEVFMTEGKYGYIVKTRHQKGNAEVKAESVRRHLSRLGLGCTEVLSHYHYRK